MALPRLVCICTLTVGMHGAGSLAAQDFASPENFASQPTAFSISVDEPTYLASAPSCEGATADPCASDISVADLCHEIEQLKKELAQKADKPPSDAQWQEISNRAWTGKVGGRVLTEGVTWIDDVDGTQQNYFEIRQIRLELTGEGYGVLDYRVQVDYEPEVDVDGTTVGSVGMKDAFVGIQDIPLLGYVRLGHFKVFFSHDQILSRKDMTFMERNPMSDPAGFTPGREVGVSSFNHTDDLRHTWAFGGFVDSISETTMQRLDDNQGFLAAGRYTWLPYYDEPSEGRYLLHLGAAAIYTHTQDDSGRFRQRPEIHEGDILIDTGAIAANDYWVLGTEALLQWGSFYAFNELMYTHVNEIGLGTRDLYGGYVELGYRLTGEHRQYNRQRGYFAGLSPHTNFWWVPGCQGIGAWEVAARYSFVDFTDSPNQSKYDSFAMALNWYWTPRTRLQLNWINPTTGGQPFGDATGSILLMRMAAYF